MPIPIPLRTRYRSAALQRADGSSTEVRPPVSAPTVPPCATCRWMTVMRSRTGNRILVATPVGDRSLLFGVAAPVPRHQLVGHATKPALAAAHYQAEGAREVHRLPHYVILDIFSPNDARDPPVGDLSCQLPDRSD